MTDGFLAGAVASSGSPGTASICARTEDPWVCGSFGGLLMKGDYNGGKRDHHFVCVLPSGVCWFPCCIQGAIIAHEVLEHHNEESPLLSSPETRKEKKW